MTWNKFWAAFNKKEVYKAKCKERDSKYPNHLSDLVDDNDTKVPVGVDVFVWLHEILAYKDVYNANAIQPPVPNVAAVQRFMSRVDELESAGLEPWFVFDGRKNPAKETTDAGRSSEIEEAQNRLDELSRDPRLHRINEVDKCLKDIASPTEHFVSQILLELKKLGHIVIGAPLEADAQLAYLQIEGFVAAVVSKDGDMLAFGVETLVTDINWQTGDCFIVSIDDVLEHGGNKNVNFHGVLDDYDSFCIASCIMGNDYIDPLCKIKGKNALTWPTLLKTAKEFIEIDGEDEALEFLEDFAASHAFKDCITCQNNGNNNQTRKVNNFHDIGREARRDRPSSPRRSRRHLLFQCHGSY